MHADSKIIETTVDERRYTYNEDLLWILDHLGKNGKILKLILSFGGRRSVMMSARDRDFLIALKGVKTDKLDVGDPDPDGHDVGFSQSLFPLPIQISPCYEALYSYSQC